MVSIKADHINIIINNIIIIHIFNNTISKLGFNQKQLGRISQLRTEHWLNRNGMKGYRQVKKQTEIDNNWANQMFSLSEIWTVPTFSFL
jgi:hypothetical protein